MRGLLNFPCLWACVFVAVAGTTAAEPFFILTHWVAVGAHTEDVLSWTRATQRQSAVDRNLGIAGALINPTGRPLGGGEDYIDWVAPGTVRVRTKAALLDALGGAGLGDVIYVDDLAVIDLTILPEQHQVVAGGSIVLKAGVTLASGRGRAGSRGALLFSERDEKKPLFSVGGTEVRVTGLRIRGPDMGIEPQDCGGHDATGVAIEPDTIQPWVVRIDNNELWGWPNSAVSVTNATNVHVHHNHIHHNRRQMHKSGCEPQYGLGYGVVANPGRTIIEANIFDHNRHDIASNGSPGSEYEARYNLVLKGAVDHSFDVHDNPGPDGDGFIAGTRFDIHHNTFLQDHTPAVHIREKPLVGAWVHHNEFLHSTQSSALKQSNDSGNLHVSDNAYSVNRFPAWFVSLSGESTWAFRRFEDTAVQHVALGDFDGDGTTDALRATGSEWQVSKGARLPWTRHAGFARDLSQVAFADFNGDGKADAFRATGSEWLVAYGATGSWMHLNTSGIALSGLAFADFNGDGKVDVFHATGSEWMVSYGGATAWTRLNTSAVTLSSLAFADFNGDRRADVFRATGSTWTVSHGGTSAWTHLNTSSTGLSQLRFGDFNGDRRADVFRSTDGKWTVSWSGASAWIELNRSNFGVSSLAFGDYNGDHQTDVLVRDDEG